MCGLTGFLSVTSKTSCQNMGEVVRSMTSTLEHRGPDGDGVWIDATAGVALGHRRLAIIDLSPTGSQPMVSADGNAVIAYNGEVYNHRELRAELEKGGCRFRGTSDTEVILEACLRWGVTAAAKRFIGMFAFALWNSATRKLVLVRDRLGIKPLYWASLNGTVVFGSELKSLRAHPDFQGEVDRDSLSAYLRHNYIPGPRSIYRGVSKVRPGTVLTFEGSTTPRETVYWEMADVVRRGHEQRNRLLSDSEAIDQLDTLLRDAVGRRMIADVPLGAFLSGGIDSSTVVALMQAQSATPVRTFSIGFREAGYDESASAKAVAVHLGTDHTELYVNPSDARDVIPSLPAMFDEPFADVSQLPTYLVSKLTRQHVTVALSGDGGDEVFAGYNRYGLATSMARWIDPFPALMRRATAGLITTVTPRQWDAVFRYAPTAFRRPSMGDKLHKLSNLILADGVGDLYRRIVSHWPEPDEIVVGGREAASVASNGDVPRMLLDPVERMQYLDTVTYLPDDILTKVDRASMAVSLEARVPLIDHRVVEYAWSLPSKFRRRHGQSKWILRQVLRKYVPDTLVNRPKMGFGVPIDSWLRGPLRDWAESLLNERRLRTEGYFEPRSIRQKWEQHLSGTRNWQYSLWGVLMFQAWLSAETGRLSAQ